jgi:hypothetical protein
MHQISPSRLSILGYALGGTAIQAVAALAPVATLLGPWGGPLIVVAGAVAGLGFNRIAAGLDKKKDLQAATRELLTNRDIVLAQARAIGMRLERYGRELGKGSMASEKKRLLAIARNAEAWWPLVVSDPFREELANVRDDHIVGKLAPYLAGHEEIILDKDVWTALLGEADRRTKGEPKLDAQTTKYFAIHLAGDFAHDFVEVLKTDLQTDGKAYAAVSLRFFGEILSGVRDLANTQENLRSSLDQLPMLLKHAQEASAALRAAQLPPDLERALFSTEKRLAGALEDLQQRIDQGFAEAPSRLAEELERRQLLRPTAQFKSDMSHFDVSEYPPGGLIGRDDEIELLGEVWAQAGRGETNRPRISVFVAWGGEGKTALVAKWVAGLASHEWAGCDVVFAWTFRENNAELFLKKALTFFGEEAMAGSGASDIAKGLRLAELFGERRSLLVLDGLEPLQYGPASPLHGELKEPGMAAMFKRIALASRGLCLVTTQYRMPGLDVFSGSTVLQKELPRLSRLAGVELLQAFGVRGSPQQKIPFNNGKEQLNELEKLVEDVHGHALSLQLFGSFLRDFYAGDIRHRDQVKLKDADAETGRRAFRVMDAYVQAFKRHGKSKEEKAKGKQSLALLELLGLFDRPVTVDCLSVLWTGKPIRGLTKPLFTSERKWWGLRRTYHRIDEAQRNGLLARLKDAKLITIRHNATSGQTLAVDVHPLVREYFSRRVRLRRPAAWRAAHRRIYEHLCETTHEGNQPTLEDLQPLYQAIFHGCQANLKIYALADVYQKRLLRRQGDRLEHYTWHTLGAYASDLGVLGYFFDARWNRISADLPEMLRKWLYNEAGYCLKASGRLMDALEPLKEGASLAASGASGAGAEGWRLAAIASWNLSELNTAVGDLVAALHDAERSVTYAERNGGVHARVSARTTRANTLYLTGQRVAAEALFREAEAIQQNDSQSHRLLFSSSGFHFCELLLADSERYAWLTMLGGDLPPVVFHLTAEERSGEHSHEKVFHSRELTFALLIDSCHVVFERAGHTLMFYEQHVADLPLDIARDHLTRGRAASFQAILQGRNEDLDVAISELTLAIIGLRRANNATHIPGGLVSRALLRAFEGKLVGSDSALEDLNEAWEIAARGPMPLLLADIHLARARLFFRERSYPWNQNADETSRTAADDVSAARRLIEKHGYGRRKCELEDAEKAIEAWANPNA